MSKVLVPMQYLTGEVNVRQENEQNGYESFRILSPDLRELSVITGRVSIAFPESSTHFPCALLNVGETVSGVSVSPDDLEYYPLNPVNSYGSEKRLNIYGYVGHNRFLRIDCGNQYSMQWGSLIDLPATKFVPARSTSYTYTQSNLTVALNGKIDYDGIMNNGVKRAGNIFFEYLTREELNILVYIFNQGKGVMPLWFIDDINDDNSWMLCAWQTLKISEPYTNYFKADISVKEF